MPRRHSSIGMSGWPGQSYSVLLLFGRALVRRVRLRMSLVLASASCCTSFSEWWRENRGERLRCLKVPATLGNQCCSERAAVRGRCSPSVQLCVQASERITTRKLGAVSDVTRLSSQQAFLTRNREHALLGHLAAAGERAGCTRRETAELGSEEDFLRWSVVRTGRQRSKHADQRTP